jgi:RNase H-like domain found in reverse transcriptase/Reverse transcriptase (RNA-dependent DNA polymerase)/Integrase zinc binding domain/Ty3 transposon capsid-like protein/Chromo (CHRromatin Organisation MOdifier) domain
MSHTPEIMSLPSEDYRNLLSMANSISQLYNKIQELEKKSYAPPTYPEPRISDPEHFDGKRHLLKNFISQLRLVIFGQPSRYPNERSKVMFAASFLRGSAFSWFQPFLSMNQTPVLDDFELFIKRLEETYGDPDEIANAERRLCVLRQTNSASAYASEFRRIASLTEWNDPALCCQYYRGLRDSVKDELSKIERPSTLSDLIEVTIKIDNRLHDRFVEKSGLHIPVKHHQNAFNPPTTFTKSQPKEDPMIIDGSQVKTYRLSDEERKRRRDLNLCLYCGQPGHTLHSCKLRKKPSQINANSVNPMPQPFNYVEDNFSPEEHLVIPITLTINGNLLSTKALLDSGATSLFVDTSFCQNNSIPLVMKPFPCDVEVIDGRPLSSGRVTHETIPVVMKMKDHTEICSFDVVTLKHYPVILGIPWFKAHNPSIVWSTHTLSFPECTSCKETTLSLSVSATSNIILPENPEIDLPLEHSKISDSELISIVPPQYHNFLKVFSPDEANILPDHSPYDHKIPLVEGSSPPYGPIYSLSQVELNALSEYLDENLKKGFIHPSTSPAGAPILFAKKKDGSLRLCVDYRGLNKVTVKNRYPLPLIHELLDRLQGAKIFTKLDLRGAYNLVRIAAGDEWKTAFRTRYGHFEYMVMPFGLTNAPATFQALMNDTLREFLDVFVIVYLDDILVFSINETEHITHVTKVLQRLQDCRLFVKIEKSSFHQDTVDFLGYRVSASGLLMDLSKIKTIQSWPIPKDIRDIQSFLGFANFYRRFILNYAKAAQPLTNLLKKNVPFVLSSNVIEAFERLKSLFVSAPILRHFDPTKKIILETDASDFALGAVLSQVFDDKSTYPIAFYSRKLSPAEQNYPIFDKEMLAIIAALIEWRSYLEGSSSPFIIYTDHKNLEYFTTTKSLNRRQARWSEILPNYDFTIVYRPGSRNGKADALSRRQDYRPEMREDTPGTNDMILLPSNRLILNSTTESKVNYQAALLKDPFYLTYSKYLEDPTLPRTLKLDKLLQYYSLVNGKLYFKEKTYIPDDKKIKYEILKYFHDSPTAGHFGQHKTYELVSRTFYWPKMKLFIDNYVLTCLECQRNKTPRHKTFGLLKPLPIPSRPWSSIGMDFIVKLPNSDGFDSILCVIDRLTKMAHFVPCNETIASSGLALLFLENIFKLHGLPDDIVSDRGSVFISKFWQRFLELLKIESNLSTAFHPQTDGQTERLNGILEQYIRIYCNYQQNDWCKLLPLAEFAYNNSIQASTKQTPFYANYGLHPCFSPLVDYTSKVPAAESYLRDLHKTHEELKINIRDAQRRYSKYYNKSVKEAPQFKVGDKVWLIRKFIKTSRECDKLDYRSLGPFEIIEVIGTLTFRLRLPETMKIHNVFHVSLLEPYHSDADPVRTQLPPPPIIVKQQEEYEVKEILDSRLRRNKIEYLIDWLGYGPEDRTWQTIDTLTNCVELVEAFHIRYPNKPNALTFGARPKRGDTVTVRFP